MDTKEVVIDGKPLVVVLSDNTKALEEVVVIGYQTIKKADLTGSVSVFKPETMKNTVVTGTVADALASLPAFCSFIWSARSRRYGRNTRNINIWIQRTIICN